MKDFKPKVFQDKQKSVTVFHGLCKGCGLCVQKCPVKAIKFSEKDLGIYYLPTVEVDIKKCIACGLCELTCPDCAIRV
jgi:2-oxoglutarate ferredoxin oxidoreductase subunit delta